MHPKGEAKPEELVRARSHFVVDAQAARLGSPSIQLGAQWAEVGSEKPQTGAEISNEALASALREKREFGKEEWDKFNVSHVTCDSYIKVGDMYFQPAVPGLIKFQRLVRKMSNGPSGMRLHAKLLGDRLLFEQKLVRGMFRLMNQLLMFCAIVYALELGAKNSGPPVQRGIYNNLREFSVGKKTRAKRKM